MEEHLLHSIMSKYIQNKQHILILDNKPDFIEHTFKKYNKTATYTINGPSSNKYDLAWINLTDQTIMDTIVNMLIQQFPLIVIITRPVKIIVPQYFKLPLTHHLHLITRLKSNIKRLQFLSPVLQAYNFNLGSVKYGDGMLHAFRVANSKFNESSIIFAYINNDNANLLHCINYHQNKDNSYEDPRLFTHNNRFYIMYVYINPYQLGKHTKLLLKVDEIAVDLDKNIVNTVHSYTPPYGKNLENGLEKNWAFWSSPTGKLLCQYAPGHILEWPSLEYAPRELSKIQLPYKLRGGAPGVIYNDKVYCFCHSPFTMNLGLVVYSNTDNPTPIGIAIDIIKECDYEGAFFYVCGATITDKRWRLTGGMTDAACTIIELDADEVDNKIERLPGHP